MKRPPFPKKHLSQHFLSDANIARKIVDAAQVDASDAVVEIGCGQGALTRWLLDKGCRVFGVEFDAGLIEGLERSFGRFERFTLVHKDVLEWDFEEAIRCTPGHLRVVGNLPYHISSAILFRLLDLRRHIASAVVMLQREVAARIVSVPGSKEYGILSVLCQYHADVRRLFDVPPTAFFPRPRVHSSILRMTPRPPLRPAVDEDLFRLVVRTSFHQRRKMLRNSLSAFLAGREWNNGLERRPEQLSVNEFVELSDRLRLLPSKGG